MFPPASIFIVPFPEFTLFSLIAENAAVWPGLNILYYLSIDSILKVDIPVGTGSSFTETSLHIAYVKEFILQIIP